MSVRQKIQDRLFYLVFFYFRKVYEPTTRSRIAGILGLIKLFLCQIRKNLIIIRANGELAYYDSNYCISVSDFFNKTQK